MGRASHRDCPAVPLDDRLDDGEAEAAAFGAGGARRVHLVEAIEDVRQMLGWDAGAGIADRKNEFGAHEPRLQRDAAAGAHVAERICREVLERLKARSPETLTTEALTLEEIFVTTLQPERVVA